MGKQKTAKSFIGDIIWTIVYMIVIVVLSLSGMFLFCKNYYSICWVDGQSMYPTFNREGNLSTNPKNIYDLTLFDEKDSGKNSLVRFDIVTTYYQGDYDSKGDIKPTSFRKIKRLIGFPNETIKITYDKELFDTQGKIDYSLYIKKTTDPDFVKYTLPFDNSISYTPGLLLDITLTLGEGEYAVKGDNWGGYKSSIDNWYSYDSFTGAGKIRKNYIHGKYIAYIGTCGYQASNPHYCFPRFYHV